jgi:molybdenum cofactor cytidylyltransferase
VHNEDWSDGIGSSISLGISSVEPAVQGAFVILGDMPFVDRELLNALAKAFERTDGEGIVFPESPNGAQRNPVLWPQRFFPDLEQLRGDEGGKSLLARHGSWCTAVGGYSETTFHDVDTLDDLCAIRRISR